MKTKEIIFQESQKFGLWAPLLMLAVSLLFVFGFIQQIILGKLWGDNPMGDISLIIVTVLILLLAVAFFVMKMKTMINNDGIYVNFFPFQLKYKFFSWNEIEKAYIRRYRPLSEYGGWGVRSGMSNSKAYNTSGNIGLQLVFTNSKKILIGTHKQEELVETLRKLGKLNE